MKRNNDQQSVSGSIELFAIEAGITHDVLYFCSGDLFGFHPQDFIGILEINVPFAYATAVVEQVPHLLDILFVADIGFKNKYFHNRAVKRVIKRRVNYVF